MCSIADIQKLFSYSIISTFNPYSQKVFRDVASCHTEAKGKHVYKCDNNACGHIHYQYHSCGNRHCLFCGSTKRDDWIEKLTADLLPTSYYHVVFTLPHELNSMILGNRKALFTLLFASAKDTLLIFGKDKKYLGGTIGITTVLHTWGQELNFHPHVHCIVSGGGIDGYGKWIEPKRKEETFLFPVQAMKIVYRAIFLKRLRKMIKLNKLKTLGTDIPEILKQIADKTWNVYAKAPFNDVRSVVEYLGRYTHKVALSHHRIQSITERNVSFTYKDYQDSNKKKVLTISKEEFLRRLEQHILPSRYVKIRHFGYLQNHGKKTRIEELKSQLKIESKLLIKIPIELKMMERYQIDILQCKKCNTGRYQLMEVIHAGHRVKSEDEINGCIKLLSNKAPPQYISL